MERQDLVDDSPQAQYQDTGLAPTTSSAYPSATAPPEWSLSELINPFPGNIAHNQAPEPHSPADSGLQQPSRPRSHVCTASVCALLPGFTSKGDLTRHQREIHENGGPKAFFCPHRECKRSTGTPFKRKENLKDHLRRVHTGVEAANDKSDEVNGASARGRVSDSPQFRLSLPFERKERSETLPLSVKRRKRCLEPESPGSDMAPNVYGHGADEGLEAQVKRLKHLVVTRETELKTIATERDRLRQAEIEKDAQIRLLKDMVQDLCTGRLSGL
ncbi:hypothetical protein MMC18_007507 [Xylographa bjoerkii]|nr:hypothetical protein [Xylographa bjoerkii]